MFNIKKWLKKLGRSKDRSPDKKKKLSISPSSYSKARVISRAEHVITRKNISKNALKVLYRLHEEGFDAFLVGGSVRDLLLNRIPKDFDVATNAKPEDVYKLFRNCRIIGKRFRLAHVYFGNEIIEVATFRGDHEAQSPLKKHLMSNKVQHSVEGLIIRDNVYGNIEEDVLRRDFTINALYYNIADFSVVDFVGGWEDLQQCNLKIIGDPNIRYREDPVRILRAIRFSAKLGFHLDEQTKVAITELGSLIQHVSAARLFEEYLKLFLSSQALNTFHLLRHYKIFELLFPSVEAAINLEFHNEINRVLQFIELALINTDLRLQEGKSVAPGFLLATFLWWPLHFRREQLIQEGLPIYIAHQEAIEKLLKEQQKHIAIPKRFSQTIRDIWYLQFRLQRRAGNKAYICFEHPKFRSGYDFLLLRAEVGEPECILLSEWWTAFIESDDETRKVMVGLIKDPIRRKKRSRKPK
ncbi:MAG: pcnB [Francisellaceae bacterium]|nr:pcnB [Francisellaceae bacterium]